MPMEEEEEKAEDKTEVEVAMDAQVPGESDKDDNKEKEEENNTGDNLKEDADAADPLTPMETDSPAETSSSKPDQEKGEENKKKEVTVGGIQHKLMSPTKGPSLEASSLARGNYPTFRTADPSATAVDDMDIFRVERLWRDESGQRFAFGHHYLRPRETYHEPSRRFFPNEVFRVPIYEVLPLDSVWARCWVLDPQTFCRGRPVGAVEEHVYICEHRVDKGARSVLRSIF